jgi:hypothetical protein
LFQPAPQDAGTILTHSIITAARRSVKIVATIPLATTSLFDADLVGRKSSVTGGNCTIFPVDIPPGRVTINLFVVFNRWPFVDFPIFGGQCSCLISSRSEKPYGKKEK